MWQSFSEEAFCKSSSASQFLSFECLCVPARLCPVQQLLAWPCEERTLCTSTWPVENSQRKTKSLPTLSPIFAQFVANLCTVWTGCFAGDDRDIFQLYGRACSPLLCCLSRSDRFCVCDVFNYRPTGNTLRTMYTYLERAFMCMACNLHMPTSTY